MSKQRQSESDFRGLILAYSRGGFAGLGALGQSCPAGYVGSPDSCKAAGQGWSKLSGQECYKCQDCSTVQARRGANDASQVGDIGASKPNARGQCVWCNGTDYPNFVNDPSNPTAGASCPAGQTVVTNSLKTCWGCRAAGGGAPGGGGGGGSCSSAYPNAGDPAHPGATICGASQHAEHDPANANCYRCAAGAPGAPGACTGAYFSKAYWKANGGTHVCCDPEGREKALEADPSNANCVKCVGLVASGSCPAPAAGGGGGGRNVPNPPGGWQGTPPPSQRGYAPPNCPSPFQWQMQCTFDHPKSILTTNGCNYCLRDNSAPCPQGYQKPPRGWIFGGCPAGYDFDVNEATGCVACLVSGCPRPYVRGPLTCQYGDQIHHPDPRLFNCVVCPGPPGTTPAAPVGPEATPSGTPGALAPAPSGPAAAVANLSTGVKVAIGAGILALIGYAYSRSRR